MIKSIRFSQAARKHRIGRAYVFHVIATGRVEPTVDPHTAKNGLMFTGPDERGVDLTVVMVEEPMYFLVIHVQPAYRRRKQ